MELELEPLDKSPKKPGKQPLDEPHYEGPNRRVAQRRCGHDRRNVVRYEPGSADRRAGAGADRRTPDTPWDKGHTQF